MYRFKSIIAPLVTILFLIGIVIPVTAAPPELPSSFYGSVSFQTGDGVPAVGDTISVSMGGSVAATTTVASGLVYSLNVPGTSSNEGAGLTFTVGTRVVATAVWHSGTNVVLNLHPPKAITGGPYTGSVGQAVSLTGSAADGGSDASSYAWDLDNDGAYDDASAASTTYTWTSTGSKTIGLKVVDAQGGVGTASTTVTISAGTASFEVTGLAPTYDGTAKAVTVVPTPSSITYTVTYDGSLTAPTNAGTYAVVVTSTDANYSGSTTKNLVIAKASSSTVVTGGTWEYDGASHAATVAVTGAGGLSLTPSPTYSCTSAPVNVSDTPCTASYTYAGDTNHEGSSNSATLTITKKAASVTPNTATKVYNTSDPSFTGTLSGFLSADGILATYARSAGETVAGSPYTISAILSPSGKLGNYSITYNTAAFTITKATAGITLSNLTQVYDGNAKSPTATTTPSGLSVTYTYNGSSTAPTDPGSYAIVASISDANYQGSTTGTLIIQAKQSISLVSGWNLVSFNLVPSSTAIADVLSSISDKYSLVYAWDGSVSSSNWLIYDPSASYSNTLSTLSSSQGFWINMNQAATLDVVGTAQSSTPISLYTNGSGWNLVGFPAGSSGALPDILTTNGISSSGYSIVYAYHASDASDPWKLYDRAGESYANDLTVLQPGWGYWIKVSTPATWTVAY